MNDVLTGRLRMALSCTLVAALAGCSAVPGLAAVPAASPAPAAPAPTTPVRVLTIAVPTPRKPAPALATTGTAWPAILASLAGYGQWLLANPDPALVATVAEPGCATANLISQQVAGLLRDRAYLQPAPPVFATVTGPAGAAVPGVGAMVTLGVTVSRPSEPVLSRTGKPITTFSALPPTALWITLYEAADKKWRLCTVDPLPGTSLPDDPPVSLL